MDSFLDTIDGLPVHAIVVHAAVVLVPLTALGAILMAAVPSFSRRFGPLVVLVGGAAAATCFVAKASGEQLAARVGLPEQHASVADDMPLVATVLFVLLLVFWLFDRGIPLNRSRPFWLVLLAVALAVMSVLALWWVFRVGHTGAQAVWTTVIEGTTPSG